MKEFILGDCLDGIKEYPDNFFDLAIVDPPYGIGIANVSKIGLGGHNNYTPKNWDNATPDLAYFKELMRVSQNQIIWGGNYFDLPPTRCFIVWDKGPSFKNRTYAEAELAWTSFDQNVKICNYNPLARSDYKNRIHITQKPPQVYKWILRNYAESNFKILDTHVGSASSLIAFEDFGCEYIGYEIDEDYYDAALKRLNQHKAQLNIFQK